MIVIMIVLSLFCFIAGFVLAAILASGKQADERAADSRQTLDDMLDAPAPKRIDKRI